MKLSCSSQTIKYLMFAFNLFFVISGIIIIAVGAAVKTIYTEYSEFLDGQYFSLPNMLIATGAFIFIISFFGCCGAIKESWIMLGIFSLLLCIIFIFEFASGIAGYVLRNKTADYLDDKLRQNLATYNHTHDVWDLIQNTFQCCGVDSYEDWKGHFSDSFALPVSCCKAVSGTAGAFYCNSHNRSSTTSTPFTEITTPIITETSSVATTVSPSANATTATSASTSTSAATTPSNDNVTSSTENTPTSPPPQPTLRRKRDVAAEVTTTPSASTSDPYSVGCKTAFGNYIKKHAVQIGGCALGLAIIQILGIAFSCYLVRQLKNGYYST